MTIGELPTGVVTFLFTDIEGSTRLWERSPVEMKAALARHDEILRETIEAHGGHVFKYVGDAVYAAFGVPDDALAAALEAQRRLHGEAWPEPTPIRVRIALHTGRAERLDSDYVGPTLNRCARLTDLAHGGQTLLSLETRQRLSASLPEGADLIDMSAHRLRDLAQPERVYQLQHPELRSDFPPLRSLDSLPNNLPVRRSAFIGREREMAEVRRMLVTTSLLTLTGAGGCGKSRLAQQVAADSLDRFPDGVWVVSLATLEEASLLAQRVASALGLAEEPGRDYLDTAVDYLRHRQPLLLLDDCEHLVDACAGLCRTLLEGSPGLKILATSREVMDIEAESAWQVPPMSLPDPEVVERLDGDDLVAYVRRAEGPQLFEVRASSAVPGFAIDAANARDLSEVCRRLDGIPLAIELAAVRVKVMSVAQVLARLDDRFALLTDGRRDVPPHQQTLRALIDWSYDLLPDGERRLFGRLSVFRGSWTLEAAEAVCRGGAVPASRVLDLLTALVTKSLVRVREHREGMRYEFLHTIQQYAWAKLSESTEADAVHRRLVAWGLTFAEALVPDLVGPDQAARLDALDRERDNLRAALSWSTRRGLDLGDGRAAASALRLAAALVRYWERRGHQKEARVRLDRALSIPRHLVAPKLRAPVLVGAGLLAGQQGDFPDARHRATEGLALYRDLGDRAGMAAALSVLAQAAQLQGDLPSAREYAEAALALYEARGDRSGIAAALYRLGTNAWTSGQADVADERLSRALAIQRDLGDRYAVALLLNARAAVAFGRGDTATATALFDEGLAMARAVGDRRGAALVLHNLGRMALEAGETERARALLAESLALKREVGDRRGEANTLNLQGDLALAEGDAATARQRYDESLVVRRELRDTVGIAETLESLAGLALAEDHGEQAARLLGAAAALRWEIGVPLKGDEQRGYDARLAAARKAIGEAEFAACWAAGRETPWQSAVATVLGEAP